MADMNDQQNTESSTPSPGTEDVAGGTASHATPSRDPAREPGPSAGPLRPLVDLVARIKVGVHAKLLTGFLIGAFLLLLMGVFSLVVLSRIGDRVDDLTRLQEKVDRARQMEYAVTAQSHFRAMALLTLDDANNTKIAKAKKGFLENLEAVEGLSPPEKGSFFDGVREANGRFSLSSQKVLAIYEGGDIDEALQVHMDQEHPVSHELEAAMRELISEATDETMAADEAFQSDRDFLTIMVWTFSGASLAFALLVAFVMSLSFIRPVRRIESVVAGVARGDFGQQVEVPNRDEFGTLSANVNRMAQRLGNLYDDMQVELAERRRAEEELKRRATELVAVNSELESVSYSLSHDLWAPLQSAESAGRALTEQYGDTLGADGNEHLRSLNDSSQHMREMIDDMVSMSRVLSVSTSEDTEIRREDVDLSALAGGIADYLRARDPRREADFDIKEGVTAKGDTQRLRVALEELLANAWKFTGKNPRARIEFGTVGQEGQQVHFVRDDGVGFDMAEADMLFGPFQRLQSASEFEGVGVGLATVQRIVRSHGGRVWAEAEPEKGATFFFTLENEQGF